MTKEKKYSSREIRLLIGKYFEGTLSTKEMERLQDASASCQDDFADDPLMLADLRMIATITEVSANLLEESMPANLESRLDKHISRLARKSAVRRKWILSISSAAAVATFLTIGINVITSHNNSSIGTEKLADAGITLIAGPSSDNSSHQQSTSVPKAEVTLPLAATAGSPADNYAKYHKNVTVNPAKSPAESPVVAPKPSTESQSIVLPVEGITPIGEIFMDATPSLASAIIKPTDVLAQPLSTLSQAVDNVYESLEIVAKVFSEMNSSLEAASNGLALVTEIPFQSI